MWYLTGKVRFHILFGWKVISVSDFTVHKNLEDVFQLLKGTQLFIFGVFRELNAFTFCKRNLNFGMSTILGSGRCLLLTSYIRSIQIWFNC